MPVYDRSYRRWGGTLRHGGRWAPIAATGIRLGLRRRKSWIVSGIFYLFLLASLVPVLFLLVANFLYFFPPEKEFIQPFLDVLQEFAPFKVVQYPGLLWITDVLLMIYVVLFGSGLIARDRAALALPLYLSKPMHERHYVIGKFLAVAFFLSMLTLFPCLLLWLVDFIGAEDEGRLTRQGRELLGILTHCGSLVVVYSSTILGASALCRRPMWAGLLWFGTITVLGMVAIALEDGLGVPYVSAFSPSRACLSLAHPVYGLGDLDATVPGASELLYQSGLRVYADPLVCAGVLTLYCVGSLVLVRRSLRRQGL